MFRSKCIRFVGMISLMACLMSWSSCTDKHADNTQEKGLVTLKIALPEDQMQEMVPEVRGGSNVTSEGDESKISSLKFFVYSSSTVLEVYKELVFDASGNCTDHMWDAANKAIRLTITPGNKQIYCIANWALTPNAEMPLIDNTNAGTVVLLTGKIRKHSGVNPTNPPVMTGSITPNITGGEATPLTINLTRQVARVEFKFKISTELNIIGNSNITITGIKFKNLATQAYVFPQSSLSSPSGTTVWSNTLAGVTSAQLTATAADYATKYYIPEYKPTGLSTATNIIIRANYNGTTTYYTLILDPSESSANGQYPHTQYVIERNHTYQYTITLQGPGVSSEPTRGGDMETTGGIAYELNVN